MLKYNVNFNIHFKSVILQMNNTEGFSDDYYSEIWNSKVPQGLKKIKQDEYPYKVIWYQEEEEEEFAQGTVIKKYMFMNTLFQEQ